MSKKQVIVLFLLICGLVFSSFVRVTFNLHNGFIYHSWWFRLAPLPLFDLSENSSGQLMLTTAMGGYLFYLLAGILFINDVRQNRRWLLITLGFMFVTIYAIYFELSAMIHDWQGKFTGEHLWAGPVLFLLGLLIFFKILKTPADQNSR